jgi:hypothetical protein
MAFLPMMSSASPGWKKRPAETRTLSRTSRTRGETPRTWTLASVPVLFRGNAAMTTTSAEESGPRSSRATPAAPSITRKSSRVTALTISEFMPASRTIAFRGDPEATSVARKPWANASMATKTPTVPATPSTATIAEDQRWNTLRTL